MDIILNWLSLSESQSCNRQLSTSPEPVLIIHTMKDICSVIRRMVGRDCTNDGVIFSLNSYFLTTRNDPIARSICIVWSADRGGIVLFSWFVISERPPRTSEDYQVTKVLTLATKSKTLVLTRCPPLYIYTFTCLDWWEQSQSTARCWSPQRRNPPTAFRHPTYQQHLRLPCVTILMHLSYHHSACPRSRLWLRAHSSSSISDWLVR